MYSIWLARYMIDDWHECLRAEDSIKSSWMNADHSNKKKQSKLWNGEWMKSRTVCAVTNFIIHRRKLKPNPQTQKKRSCFFGRCVSFLPNTPLSSPSFTSFQHIPPFLSYNTLYIGEFDLILFYHFILQFCFTQSISYIILFFFRNNHHIMYLTHDILYAKCYF